MKLAVVGSRGFEDYGLLRKTLDEYPAEITEIISGGARGADSLGSVYAQEMGIPLTTILPEWDKYGKSAGFRRDADIIKACDECVAFWDGKSKGTKHDIDLCDKYGKKITIIRYDE